MSILVTLAVIISVVMVIVRMSLVIVIGGVMIAVSMPLVGVRVVFDDAGVRFTRNGDFQSAVDLICVGQRVAQLLVRD